MHLCELIYGFVWGFLLCFTFGPAFFAIVQVGIDASLKKGILLSAGVVASDILMIFIAIFGTSFLPNFNKNIFPIEWIGVVLLIGMGLFSIFSKRKQLIYPESKIGNFLYFWGKGFLLNALNPTNLIFIISTCAYLKNVFFYNTIQLIFFFGSSIVATFLAQILIAYYAGKIKSVLTNKTVDKINKLAGICFIIAGCRIMIHVLNQ